MPAPNWKLRSIRRVLAVVATGFLVGSLRGQALGKSLSPELTKALDAVLECERPQGGWMYVCEHGVRVTGLTNIVKRAERVAAPVGLARWDLVILRSPGTSAAGLLLLRAYGRTGRDEYLAAARRTGELLVNLQLPSGGWFSEMPVYGKRLAAWFRAFSPWTTLDDDVTSGAVRMLLSLWEVTGDSRYRDAAERGLDLLLEAQLPSGAWPLTWRPAWLRFISPNFEDWPSLNDGATTGVIHALIVGARALDRPELLDVARRGGEWLLRAQGGVPNAGWAQQYDEHGHPGPGRRFEPAALTSWESRYALETLSALAEATGDRRFCRAFAGGVDWLVRSALGPGCWARFYSIETNQAVYIDKEGKSVSGAEQAKRPYRWKGDFGIPALLASLGLDQTGRPLDPAARSANVVWRLAGDTGECPGENPATHPETRSLKPWARIARAASRLAVLEPAGSKSCAPFTWK